jgi:hypothetical protein
MDFYLFLHRLVSIREKENSRKKFSGLKLYLIVGYVSNPANEFNEGIKKTKIFFSINIHH